MSQNLWRFSYKQIKFYVQIAFFFPTISSSSSSFSTPTLWHDKIEKKIKNSNSRKKNWLKSKLITTARSRRLETESIKTSFHQTQILIQFTMIFFLLRSSVDKFDERGKKKPGEFVGWNMEMIKNGKCHEPRDKIWLKVDNRGKKIEFQELLEHFFCFECIAADRFNFLFSLD